MNRETLDCEVLIIGSGPGGATTGAMLAEAGRDVLMIEEGPDLAVEATESYSLAEMNQKYRNGGLTSTLGRTNVTYIEGRCVGGASEVNAALYHRPLPETLNEWRLLYQIDGLSYEELSRHFDAVEADLNVSPFPNGVGPASESLRQGAERLGWKSREIQRFWRYDVRPDGSWTGARQSMSRTLVPRARRAGMRLLADTRVSKILFKGTSAREVLAITRRDGETRAVKVRFKHLFVCAGAIQTPLLLRNSGVTHNVGNSLRLHPMIRVAARFPYEINDPSWGVPVEQIEQFKPLLTLGCSHSSLPHIALWLTGDGAEKQRQLEDWKRMAVFYVAAVGTGKGSIRNVPVFNEPLVRLDVTNHDLALLGEGLYRLGEVLFAAGAEAVFSPLDGAPPAMRPDQLAATRTGLPHGLANVSTIHLFSSCPMGEDSRECAVNSYGKLHGVANVTLNDASILPRSPAVNPQGTILAIARRNAERWLAEH